MSIIIGIPNFLAAFISLVKEINGVSKLPEFKICSVKPNFDRGKGAKSGLLLKID